MLAEEVSRGISLPIRRSPVAERVAEVEGRRTIRRPGVVEVRSAAELLRYADQWQDLVGEALAPNVFHEPWMMLPAIESYGRGRDLRFVLVFTPGDPPTGPAVLAGFFPLELQRNYQRIPVSTLALWRYPHCFLGTPLLRRSSAQACLDVFFDWVMQPGRPWSLLELGRVSGEGSFHRLLLEQISKRGLFVYRAETYLRALFEPAEDADAYLENSLTGKKRKELRRQINRLGELGRVEFDELDDDDDPAPWIDQFLALEASGWKGEEGTALLSSEEDRRFFSVIAREAFDRGVLSMLALRLDGTPIAMKCNVETGHGGAFALKVAFDEAYARFSPGVALEIESIRRLHDQRRIQWMDSCAEAHHSMIDRLWTGRRLIESVVLSARAPGGDLLVSVMPFLRWLRHQVRRRAPARTPMVSPGG